MPSSSYLKTFRPPIQTSTTTSPMRVTATPTRSSRAADSNSLSIAPIGNPSVQSLGNAGQGSGSLDVGYAGVIGRPGTWRGPEKRPLVFADRHVVDARLAAAHQPLPVELPQLVAVAAEPRPRAVVPLVPEADGDAVAGEGPERLHQSVVEFALPLAGEERPDRVAAGHELAAVPPDRVRGVGRGDAVRVAGVPGVLGDTHLQECRLRRERRDDYPGYGGRPDRCRRGHHRLRFGRKEGCEGCPAAGSGEYPQ